MNWLLIIVVLVGLWFAAPYLGIAYLSLQPGGIFGTVTSTPDTFSNGDSDLGLTGGMYSI